MLDQITPLIITYNEAPNIRRVLAGLVWARDIVVVDSFSDDETVAIAKSFPQVRVFQRTFDNHRNQWQYALKETDISTPWVLALDADYIVSDEFINELEQLEANAGVAGYQASFIYCINGKKLRSGIYPPVTVLYRRDRAAYVQDGHTQRVTLDGPVAELQKQLMHDDRKPLRRWLNSQSSYTELEAQKLLAAGQRDRSLPDRLRRWMVVMPPATLCYCLIWRGAIFDGWAGWYYTFQRVTAELMLAWRLSRRYFEPRAAGQDRLNAHSRD